MGLGWLLRDVLIMKQLTKTTVRIFVAVIASGAMVGVALTVGVAAGSDSGSSSPRTTASVAAAVPIDLASSFGVLASSTVLPSGLASDLGWTQDYGVNPSLGHQAGAIGDQRFWLIPGSSQSCLELDSGYSACGSNRLVEQQGVWLILEPVSGAAPTMYGVVPDGATVSGDAASVKISQSGNAVMMTSSSSTPGRFTLQTASGTTVDMSVPAATAQP